MIIAIGGGLALALNDIKSRLTPPPGQDQTMTVVAKTAPVEIVTHGGTVDERESPARS